MEHYDGMKCGCTIQKEFYAFAAEYDYLIYSGIKIFLMKKYAGIYDANGRIDTGHLWDVIKKDMDKIVLNIEIVCGVAWIFSVFLITKLSNTLFLVLCYPLHKNHRKCF